MRMSFSSLVFRRKQRMIRCENLPDEELSEYLVLE